MKKQWMHFIVISIIVFGITFGWTTCANQATQPEKHEEIDRRSYNLGVIGAFSEVVAVGVKKLALSSPLPPQEMAQLLPEAERIARENGASIYLEKDFLTTDLFPEEITEGMHVLLIYLDPVKDEYMALKAEKEKLIKAGQYQGNARQDIARKMGRLLSYPEQRITKMLAERSE